MGFSTLPTACSTNIASRSPVLSRTVTRIRQYGATSVQVLRRLRSALLGLTDSLSSRERADAVRRYLDHLDLVIERSTLDAEDRLMAHLEDRQGLGLSRGRPAKALGTVNTAASRGRPKTEHDVKE
jgi:uncharacterized membrane protein